jgi:hypothetical protein
MGRTDEAAAVTLAAAPGLYDSFLPIELEALDYALDPSTFLFERTQDAEGFAHQSLKDHEFVHRPVRD